jgi:hypothetical protein
MPVEMESAESDCRLDPPQDKLQVARQAKFLSEFVGTWIGHAQDALGRVNPDGTLPTYAFPSGSTRILLEVSNPDQVVAQLTFGAGEPPPPASDANLGSPLDSPDLSGCGADFSALPPADGFVYSAEPVASALDLERSADDDVAGEPLALDGKLVLAFSTSCATGRCNSTFVSELYLRFAGEGLIGVFDGLNLINERGFLTRPGSVRFRRATSGRTDPGLTGTGSD